MSKSKKKLKRRLQKEALQGAATIAQATENLATLKTGVQSETVNNTYGIQQSAGTQVPAMPETAAAPVDVQNNASQVSTAMDDWEDEDETTDGGSIPAVPVTVNTEVQTLEMQEIANPNIEVQTAPQENSTMNVVNHPQNAPAAAPVVAAPAAVIENSTIIAESSMEQMQRDAAAIPPAAAVAQAPAQVIAAPAAPRKAAAFHSLTMTVMVSLNLTNFDYMTDLKSDLSRVKLDGQEFNLYTPFRKAGKRTDTNPAAEGILRYALSNMLDITDTLNNSRVMNVGDADTIKENLAGALDTVRNQIINLFPADMNTVVAQLEDAENQQTLQLQLHDIVNVRSWVNSSLLDEEGSEAIVMHNAVINVTVNAGTLYDAEERTKYIHQVEKVLQLVNNSREEANTALLLAVQMDASTLTDKSMRDLLDALLTDEQFMLYTRQEMYSMEDNDFLPQTKESVDADLLAPKADLLLLRLLTEDEDEGEEGEAQPEVA